MNLSPLVVHMRVAWHVCRELSYLTSWGWGSSHINTSAKCISTPGLTLLREARLVWLCVLPNVRVELSHIWDLGLKHYNWYQKLSHIWDANIWLMARVDLCVVTWHGIWAITRRMDSYLGLYDTMGIRADPRGYTTVYIRIIVVSESMSTVVCNRVIVVS